ncbi:MAG: acylphosphatase [Deltaproteobacteria bacterium]|nr:acylphosphatase [Deltaproteobacteria bacterium]
MIQRLKLLAAGRVQGVYFRVYTKREANRLGLTGTVKNFDDGSVEIIAEGKKDQLCKLIEWTKKGSPNAKVENVSVKFSGATNEWKNFEIIT